MSAAGNSKSPPSSSHTTAWVVAAVVVLLPVLYLLSVAPICWFTFHAGMWVEFDEPAWVTHYMAPHDFVYERTPLGEALEVYMEWWMDLPPPF